MTDTIISPEIEIGCRVRVRCICCNVYCLARDDQGGAVGKVTALEDVFDLVTVVLDDYEEMGGLDYPSLSVHREDA